MSILRFDQDTPENIVKERQDLFDKLAEIFDPEIAEDYVCPKTNEIRQQLSIEELRHQSQGLRHCPPRLAIYTKPRASYQSFVRNEIAQNSPRRELERFVRNSSDIDAAKRYLNIANDTLINPQQSLLLFRSSKLNEQKATLLKSSGCVNDLQRIYDDPTIEKYFSARPIKKQIDDSTEQIQEKLFDDPRKASATRSLHLQHDEKKYRVEFLKGSANAHLSFDSTRDRHRLIKERSQPDTVDSLLGTENSTARRRSKSSRISSIHRELFPPLSLTALQEYRPTVMPNLIRSRGSSSTTKDRFRRQATHKADFIWQRSLA